MHKSKFDYERMLYNYVEEIHLQSLYQFSDYTAYPCRLLFLPFTDQQL
jgi:hypothetical protein